MNPHYPAWVGFMLALLLTACWSEPPTPTPTAVPLPIATPTVSAIVRACQATRPADWVPYAVEDGDTLSDLAEARDTTVEQLKQANCLTSDLIVADETLYLPPPCQISPPTGWVEYQVRPGDTLFTLAEQRRTSVAEIARVNCLQAEDILNISQTLYLPAPSPPTLTPIPTATPTPLPPPPPTPLPTPPPIPTMPLIRPTPGIVAFNPTPATQPSANLSSNLGVQAPANPGPPQGGQPSNGDIATTPPNGGNPLPREILDFPPGWPPLINRADRGNPGGGVTSSEKGLNYFAKYDPCSKRDGIYSSLEDLDGALYPGAHNYFFICSSDKPIRFATITFPGGSECPTKLLAEPLHLDVPKTKSPNDWIIDFSVLPDPDKYPQRRIPKSLTLTIFDEKHDEVNHKDFLIVETPFQNRRNIRSLILVLPSQELDPNTYLIYYVGFTPTLTHTFGLYVEKTGPSLNQRIQSGPTSTPVARLYEPVDGKWWALSPTVTTFHPYTPTLPSLEVWYWFTDTLTLPPTDIRTGAAYAIGWGGWEEEKDKYKFLEPDWLFWPELLKRQEEQCPRVK